MQTQYFVVDRTDPDLSLLARAAVIITSGGLVAFPTETVYGLGANGLDERAVTGIYRAKGRPADNPLILHIADQRELAKLTREVTANAQALIDRFWPGPLTVILPKTRAVPAIVTGGLDTVAVRMPASVIARGLITLAGVPIAAPSANTSGRPSPTSARDVMADLDGRIDAVLDGGPCPVGVESTVVDCTTPVPTLLRPGGITLEMLTAVLGEVEVDAGLAKLGSAPRSPGMKYTHYAPRAPMILVEPGCSAGSGRLQREIEDRLQTGCRVGAVVSAETAARLPATVETAVYGSRRNPAQIAANLYAALRHFDDIPVDIIIAEGVTEEGLGLAVMNRLRKASGYRIIRADKENNK